MILPIQIAAHLKNDVICEVRRAERGAYGRERTMINITGLMEYIDEHPEKFTVLPQQSVKHRKSLISQVLTHVQKYRPYSTKTRHGGGRAFCRPKGYQDRYREHIAGSYTFTPEDCSEVTA